MTDCSATDVAKSGGPWLRRYLFCAVCAVVIGLLFLGAKPRLSVLKNTDAKDCYYNLLVQGFRAGQLNIKKEVPPGLARLSNPYDPVANAPYIADVGDISYYKGKLYLYFGAAPALVLYWPYLAMTGHYLQDSWAGLIFCTLGFLVGAGILYAIWQRNFPRVRSWAAMAGIFIFGLMIAAQVSEWIGIAVYEVALSSGFAFSMLALAAIWAALHRPGRGHVWLLLASLAYGLAVGARPSLLFGASILLIPVIQAWWMDSRSPWETCGLLAAAIGPIMLIGVGVMVYNARRFDNPLEFGFRYQITGLQETNLRIFSLHNFWFNLRYYFWEPMHWVRYSPFVRRVPSWDPSAHFGVEPYYGGLLSVVPFAWLALAAPLAWRDRPRSPLRWFIATAFLLFITSALTICLYIYSTVRYDLDFLPALMLMAVVGVFALESNQMDSGVAEGTLKGVAPRAKGHQTARFGRWVWGALAVFMVITSVCVSLDAYASTNYFAGNVLVNRSMPDEAIERFDRALAIEPQFAGAYEGLGNAFVQKGRNADAIVEYEKALEIKPDLVEPRYNLGHCYYVMGRIQDAIAQDQMVLKMDAKFAKAYGDLAACFLVEGRVADALAQLEKVVEIAPDSADARNNLGYCLLQAGRAPEAIVQYQKAVELNPQSANYRCGLGNALLKAGHLDDAISEYQKAVELAPDLAGAYYDLASGLLQSGRVDDAIAQYQRAMDLEPNSATFHWGLAGALAKKGLSNEAAAEYKKAIEIQPELAKKLQSQIDKNKH
ncbi:MAG TPA: tetratricopeptide repeat protein [Alphaproteobacteria bacterium]|nr:tetratricopeptide repeat protein [Alphaproteobacteria bacterium]